MQTNENLKDKTLLELQALQEAAYARPEAYPFERLNLTLEIVKRRLEPMAAK